MSEPDWDAARRAVKAALAAKGWNPADLSREAEVDPGTVLDFLNGSRVAQIKNRGKIERALGWPGGSLEAIAHGGPVPDVGGPPQDDLVILTRLRPGLTPSQRREAEEKLRAIVKAALPEYVDSGDDE